LAVRTTDVGAVAVTVTVNVEVAVKPCSSVTVKVTVEVPDCPAAVVYEIVALPVDPVPVDCVIVIFAFGYKVVFELVAVTTRADTIVSASPIGKVNGPTAVPPQA